MELLTKGKVLRGGDSTGAWTSGCPWTSRGWGVRGEVADVHSCWGVRGEVADVHS